MIGDFVISYSALFTLTLGFGVVVLLFLLSGALKKTHWIVIGIIGWLSIESVVLKYISTEYYTMARYAAELTMYGLFVYAAWYAYRNKRYLHWPISAFWRWFAIMIGIAIASYVIQPYSPFEWALGMRQLFRFFFLALAIYWLQYPHHIRKVLFIAVASLIGLQIMFGIVQFAAGGSLDPYLIGASDVVVGGTAVITGVEETIRGSRIFGTMGRYDRYGSLVAIGLIIATSAWYQVSKDKKALVGVFWVLALVTLLLSKSRASWLMGLTGVVSIAWFVYKDKRFLMGASVAGVAVAAYLISFAMLPGSVSTIVETPNPTFAERVFEAVSPRALRESYFGFGRIFFIVNTPLVVVPSSPFVGVGPGRYGGGAAASRLNSDVYDTLNLPFGIQNRFGQIDNNWFAIWGEFGTFGIIAWFLMGYHLVRAAKKHRSKHSTKLGQMILVTLIGVISGLAIVGFFGPYFELRGVMSYTAVLVGLGFLEYDIRSGHARPNYLDT